MVSIKLAVLALSLVGLSHGFVPTSLMNKLIDTDLSPPVTPYATQLDRITYTLVDTTLYLMQVGKTFIRDYYYEDPDDPDTGFKFGLNWTYNATRVRCTTPATCAEEDIYMFFDDPTFRGVNGGMNITTDMHSDHFNFTLRVNRFRFESSGYHHEIRSNLTKSVRVGEGSIFEMSNTTYGVTANFTYVPDLGVQISNLDILMNIGNEEWTVQRTYTRLENGFIVEGGEHTAQLNDGIMGIWNGVNNGVSFEKEYEEHAQFLINCGLSGGRVSEECAAVKSQREAIKTIFAKFNSK